MNELSDDQRLALAGWLGRFAPVEDSARWYRDLAGELARRYPTLMRRPLAAGAELDGHMIADALATAEDPLSEMLRRVRGHRRLFAHGENILANDFAGWLAEQLGFAPFLTDLRTLPEPDIDGQRLWEFYLRELENPVGDDSDELVGMPELARRLFDHGGYRRVFRFLGRIAKYLNDAGLMGGSDLRAWCLIKAERVPGFSPEYLRVDWAEIDREGPAARQHYLCRVEPEPTPDGAPDLYEFSVYRYLDEPGADGRPVVAATPSCRLEEVEAEVGKALAPLVSGQRLDRLPKGALPVVEFMLPSARIEDEVESWPAGAGGVTLGELVPVVVRPVEPHNGEHPASLRRWDQMLENNNARRMVCTATSPAQMPEPGHVCVVAGLDRGGERLTYLNTLFTQGIPLVVWRRSGGIDHGMINGSLLAMPDRLLNKRIYGAQKNSKSDIVLVWDNPHWIPERGVLTWR